MWKYSLATSVTADAGGNLLSSLRYTAFGETRYASGTATTDYRYTGQREEAELGASPVPLIGVV